MPRRNVPLVTLAPDVDWTGIKDTTYRVPDRCGRSPGWQSRLAGGTSYQEVVMSRIEDRIKELATRFSQWLNTDKKTAKQQRSERVARLRGEATERAQR